jgi:hypothetical protein
MFIDGFRILFDESCSAAMRAAALRGSHTNVVE